MSVRPFLVAATALALASFAASAEAKPCRDAVGHFTACPVAKPAPAAQRCRSAAGRFTACPSATVVARCRDGSMSRSAHRAGSCSGHGGLAGL